jgi:hypothetical protein
MFILNKLEKDMLNNEKSNFKKTEPIDFIERYFKTNKWHRYMNNIANIGARHDRMNITNSDFGLFGFSSTPITLNNLFDIFSTVGTPYLLESLTFLQSNIAFTSGFFFAVSIKRKTG